MPENAPLVFIGFLATVAILAAGTVAAAFFLIRKRRTPAIRTLEGMAVIAILYATALMTFSVTSREVVLEPGQMKYFCEVDCHEAYSVIGVQTVRTLTGASRGETGRGIFYVVTIRTWFDENTISPHRGDFPLRPNPKKAVLVDGRGRRSLPETVGETIPGAGTRGTAALSRPLRPGESYTAELVFDLPEDARDLRLWITDADADPIPYLLIGHEKSPFHARILFRLPDHGPKAGYGGWNHEGHLSPLPAAGKTPGSPTR